jgi:DME family drug/metabolite transporter
MSNTLTERADAQSGSAVPPILLVIAAALLWSTGGLFIKATQLSAFELSFGRSLLAGLTVVYFTRREGFRLNRITLLGATLYAALLLLFVMATKQTKAANAIFLQYTAPVYVLIFEPLLYREKFRLRDAMVVLCCMLGVSFFFVGRLLPEEMSGNLLALVSGVCFAFFMLLLRHPRASEVNRASAIIYGNLLLAVVTAPAFFAGVHKITLADALIVAFLGVFQNGIAYTLFTLGLQSGVRSLDAALVGFIEPLSNPIWVYIFIGERPSKWAVIGGAIIIAAVAIHTILSAKRSKQ